MQRGVGEGATAINRGGWRPNPAMEAALEGQLVQPLRHTSCTACARVAGVRVAHGDKVQSTAAFFPANGVR